MNPNCQHHIFNVPKYRMIEGKPRWIEVNECWECGGLFSLGPSNDSPEAVKIEIKAAEIAGIAGTKGSPLRYITGGHYAGYVEHIFDSNKIPESPDELTGWLARQIVSHEENSVVA